MSEAQHTPGPWHRNIRAGGKYPVVFAGRNTHVATVSQQKSGDETESNIDLIAAAPDLLEACQNLENDDGSIPEHAWSLIQAAIAKAEGRPE